MKEPTKFEITNIRVLGSTENDFPEGTELEITRAQIPGHVNVTIRLPGSVSSTDIGQIPIEGGVVHVPLKMLFLCYAKEDEEAAENLERRLKNDGFLVWMDKKSLKPGDDWRAQINDAIGRADFVLILLSEKSCTKTGEVQREIKYALEQRKLRPARQRYIIPVRLTPCTPPQEFDDIHWVDLFDPNVYGKIRDAMRQ